MYFPSYQLLVSVSAALGCVSDGMQYGWSSPVLPLLRSKDSPFQVSNSDETWLEAIYLLAGLAGLPITAYLADKIGRHKSILFASSLCLIAWIIAGIATRVEFLYVGRFIFGVAANLMVVIIPMYISEIADKKFRGFLTGLVDVMIAIGLVLMYSVAPYVALYIPSFIGVALLILQLILFSPMPESPYYLVAKEQQSAAKAVLQKLSGEENCELRLQEITNAIRKEKEEKATWREVMTTKKTVKSFGIFTVLAIAQHFCGFSVILMNLHTILATAGSGYVDPNITGITFASLMLITITISLLSIDKFGRKVLLAVSTFLTGLCLMALAIYFHLKELGFEVKPFSWICTLSVMVYAIVFNIGLGIVPKILTAELFYGNIKAIGMTYGDCAYVIFGFCSTVFYNYTIKNYNMFVPFYVFAIVSYLVLLFVMLVIPETKGKSLEEIQILVK